MQLKNRKMSNIFDIEKNLDLTDEMFIKLFEKENCAIEKIISSGQVTKEGEWLEEDGDEWVILLQGESEIKFHNGDIIKMKAGDYTLIPAKNKHRVEYTSSDPKCIWLTVHIK